MKIKLLTTRSIFALALSGVLSASLFSCKKSQEITYYSALQVIHASPGLYPVDVYFGSDRLNDNRAVYFQDTISYRSFSPQTATVTVKKFGSAISHINSSITFGNGIFYSMFVIGKPDSVTYLLTSDNLDAPAAGKAKVRFVHAGPDAPAADMKMNATTFFTQRSYGSATEFSAVDPATYQVSLSKSGTANVLATKSVVIEAGKIYTIWAKGLVTTAVDSLRLGIQVLAR